MEIQEGPSIVGADRLTNALVIAFSDGRVASFSSSLLYATLAEAEEFLPESDDEDPALTFQRSDE